MDGFLYTKLKQAFYLDSVELMRQSRELVQTPGVLDAAVMMGTPANVEILRNANLLDESMGEIAPGDLILTVRADSIDLAEKIVLQAQQTLQAPAKKQKQSGWKPPTLDAAMSSTSAESSSLALISVPGMYAAAEARKALSLGMHVMLFSDNVSLADEHALKLQARDAGLLMMGPDCGTACLNGVPLAFANEVPQGSCGIVGASGTGMQEVMVLLARSGTGVSQAIGVGGRDLKPEIGGLSTLMALSLLAEDQHTRQIVLISKPSTTKITHLLVSRLAEIDKPCVLCLLGAKESEIVGMPAHVHFASTLKEAASCASRTDLPTTSAVTARPATGTKHAAPRLVGLFTGGTLCTEAQLIFDQHSVAYRSNVALNADNHFDVESGNKTSTQLPLDKPLLLDLGDDAFTAGQPHPMIAPESRNDLLLHLLRNSSVDVVLLDMVLGHGAHVDPAEELCEVIRQFRSSDVVVIASVTGTEQDPQVRSRVVSQLNAVGVLVAECNADAATLAADTVNGR